MPAGTRTRHCKEHGTTHQESLPPQRIAERTRHHRPYGGPEINAAHRPASLKLTELEMIRKKRDCAGDNDQIEAEQ